MHLLLWVLGVFAAPEAEPPDPDSTVSNSKERWTSGAYVLIAPGVGHVNIEGDPDRFGYQWGMQAGRLWRSRTRAAIGLGASFEHAITTDSRSFGTSIDGGPLLSRTTNHKLRLQLELLPGVLLAHDRLFLHATIGVGYFGIIADERINDPRFDDTIGGGHGPVFSPGIGFNYRVWRGLTLGVQTGVDLGWLASTGPLFPAHSVDIETVVGWLF
jgi:hypothetical protein